MGANDPLAGIDNIPPDSSVMMALKEKETELKAETLKTRREAEEMVAKARAKASEIREKAKIQGIKDGKELISKGLKKAHEEAKKIDRDAGEQVDQIKKQAAENFNAAVRLVVGAIAGKRQQLDPEQVKKSQIDGKIAR